MVSDDWTRNAREELLELAGGQPGWGYRPASEPCVEPTALAGLALLAADGEPGDAATAERVKHTVQKAGDWLAGIQQKSGALGISASIEAPEWPTPHVLLFWSALGGYAAQRKLAADWLLGRQGILYPIDPQSPIGHDTSIPGWPWVANTAPWIDPTVMAILALRKQGLGDSDRIKDGLRMIRDRALPSGGWNIGNTFVFGTELRPRPPATGLALLALAGREPMEPIVEKALDYLEEELPRVRAAQSLCFGLLGMEAWKRRPDAAETWLAEAYGKLPPKANRALLLAYLLLGASRKSLGLLLAGR